MAKAKTNDNKVVALKITGTAEPFSVTGIENIKSGASYSIKDESTGAGKITFEVLFNKGLSEVESKEKKSKIYIPADAKRKMKLDIKGIKVEKADNSGNLTLNITATIPGKIKDSTGLKIRGAQGGTGSNPGQG